MFGERKMTKNYIFDFGKVLVDFEPDFMTKQYIAAPADIKLASDVIFDRLYWDRLDEGTITDDEVKEGIRSRLPERLKESAVAVYDNWYRHLPEIEGMRSLLMRIKEEGCGLYLLSNISKGFAENYSKVKSINELFSLFDGLVFSGPIGLVKPTPEIFNHLLSKYGLKPQECTFVDDNAANIEGAKAVGINTFLFSGNYLDLQKEIFSDG